MISVFDVKKFFDGRQLFECRNIVFEKTGLYIIKGPNGCGKTTFLKMLFGKDKDYYGQIHNLFKKNIMLPQQPYFFKGSVEYNLSIALSSQEDLKACQQILKEFDIPIKADINRLSAGQKQLVSFLRAFYVPSDVLFLDEPDSFLDRYAKDFVYSMIEKESKERCIVVVTHHQSESLKGNVLRFENGQIIKEGELLT